MTDVRDLDPDASRFPANRDDGRAAIRAAYDRAAISYDEAIAALRRLHFSDYTARRFLLS
jgi:hypothetical protein